jgi:chorismate mutase/prephenate dehydratase
MISKFAALGLNLTKLESRPIPGKDFEFRFYFDMEASVYSPSVLSLLDELADGPEQFVFLGSYSEG